MKISINNIGLLYKTEVLLDGLTIITGRNDSGKSSIGRTLYASIMSLKNADEKALSDRIQKVYDSLYMVSRSIRLEFSRLSIFSQTQDPGKLLSKYTMPEILDKISNVFDSRSLSRLIDYYVFELTQFRENTFDYLNITDEKKHNINIIKSVISIQNLIIMNIDTLNKLQNELKFDENNIEFRKSLILDYLNLEFDNQITPVKNKNNTDFYVSIFQNDRSILEIMKLADKFSFVEKSELDQSISKILIIDDVNVLNVLNSTSKNPTSGYHMLLEKTAHDNSINHFDFLKSILKEKKASIFERNLSIAKNVNILKILNLMVPESIFLDEKDGFVYSNDHLSLKNLADGSKMISIIKTLIENGSIDEKTILFLDEPAIHLHPEWQVYLAEIICYMIKELKVKVVLTSHNPGFIYALDYYEKSMSISNVTNYYIANRIESNMQVTYKCINDNTEELYQLLSNPTIIIDNKYIKEIEGKNE